MNRKPQAAAASKPPRVIGKSPFLFLVPGSARVSRVGFRRLAETIFAEKSAVTRRHRQQASRAR